MFAPDDPLAPPSGSFAEPWQAMVLALASALIREGHTTPSDWVNALGKALKDAETAGQPDTGETYFLAALTALEDITETIGLTAEARATRKVDWEAAYRRTPHGKPVVLS